MDCFHFLLWIYLLVVSDDVPFRSPAHRKVPRRYCVRISIEPTQMYMVIQSSLETY